ncbi:MAG: hypothetical protein ABSG99_07350 [Sedimentisphaerales bacterium]
MRQIILVVAIVLLLTTGCSIWMSPQYQQLVEMSANNVAELQRRCEVNDIPACKEGCKESSVTLNRIVDALHNRDPNTPQ